jgi:hypothetical protein
MTIYLIIGISTLFFYHDDLEVRSILEDKSVTGILYCVFLFILYYVFLLLIWPILLIDISNRTV